VANNDETEADNVISMKGIIQNQVYSAEQHEAQRLIASEPNRLAAYSVEMEVIEKLKRIYYFAKRMAKTIQSDSLTAHSLTDIEAVKA